jgi:hypothetical protein
VRECEFLVWFKLKSDIKNPAYIRIREYIKKVWEIHAACWMMSGCFTDLIDLQFGYIFQKYVSIRCWGAAYIRTKFPIKPCLIHFLKADRDPD